MASWFAKQVASDDSGKSLSVFLSGNGALTVSKRQLTNRFLHGVRKARPAHVRSPLSRKGLRFAASSSTELEELSGCGPFTALPASMKCADASSYRICHAEGA